MKILIVVCNSKKNSFNHAIAHLVRDQFLGAGHDVMFHDLYEERFDPVLTQEEIDSKNDLSQCDSRIRKAWDELASSDVIVIVHPNWWGQPPALLKGWLDRVIRDGVAFKFTPKGPEGLLKAKKAFVFNTSNTPETVEMQVYGDPLDNLWKKCIFDMCGIHDVERIMFKGVIVSTPEMRSEWLKEVRDVVSQWV